jgi:hypothetical protein
VTGLVSRVPVPSLAHFPWAAQKFFAFSCCR